MNFAAIKHIPKSHMAYAIDDDRLHILLQTAKNDLQSVKLMIGDPFEWNFVNGKYVWSGASQTKEEMRVKYSTELFDYYFVETHRPTLRSKYCFILNDGANEYFFGCRDLMKLDENNINTITANLFGYFNFPYINKSDMINSPSWIQNTIWYQIFPDRFSRDNDKGITLVNTLSESGSPYDYFYGGTLRGIINKIPYLLDLGINGIYLTPIFKSSSSHKYDTSDYYEIDPAFGTKEDLKKLVDECHKNNIKIMLDAVFNHCGFDHPYFQDVIKNKRSSKYWNCFYIEDENFINFELDDMGYPIFRHMNIKPKYKTFAFTPMMPKWNVDNPVTEKYLLDVATYWTKEFAIDGWRLDVSDEVSHTFWRKFRQRVKSINDDIYIVGESWDNASSWLGGDQFDGVMNYDLAFPVWKYFGTEDNTMNIGHIEFTNKINKHLVSYQENVLVNMYNLVGSHDTTRMLVKCGGNKKILMLSYVFLFSFCGSPSIYYGDEIGLGVLEPENYREPMAWDENQDSNLVEFFKKLIQIRKSNFDLRTVNLKWIQIEDDLISFLKNNTLIILNKSIQNRVVSLPNELQNKAWLDLYKNERITYKDSINVESLQFLLLKY